MKCPLCGHEKPHKHGKTGCVAKTGVEPVKVVFILTKLSRRHPLHESQVLVQMASLPIRHHPAVCTVVSALSALVSQSGGDDDGEGTDGGPFDGVPLGAFLMLLNWTSVAGLTCVPPMTHGE